MIMSDNNLRKRNSPTGRSKSTRSSPVKEAGTPSKKKSSRSQSPARQSKPRSPSKIKSSSMPSVTKVSSSTRAKANTSESQPLLAPDPLKRTYSGTSQPSASSSQPHLTRDEWMFHKLVEEGDVYAVDRFLKGQSYFNINCMNILGFTPLVIAAKRENLNMVELLMNRPGIVIGDAILYAVRTGNKEIVEYLLDQQPVRKRSSESIALAQKKIDERESPDFGSDIDPLILACHLDNFEIVDLLVTRGHRIERPHPPNCNCKERCHTRKAGQSLSFSLTRYHLYKAYASPSYILITATDPILMCFKLRKELKNCARNEREFKEFYSNLSDQCDQLALDLLAQCRTTEEVELIVHKRDPHMEHGAGGNKKNNFARIKLAFDFEQKLFIAHPNTQQMLRSAWLKKFRSWRTMGSLDKLGLILFRIVCMPFFVLLHWITPLKSCANLNKYNSGPLYKFLNFIASYLIFLVIICLQTYMSAKNRKRGAPHTGLEVIILMYITGYIWSNFKVMYNNGYKWFFSYKWHVFDVVSLALFLSAFVAWSCAEIRVMQDGNRYLPRHLWKATDPTLLAESLYAWATVCAFLKLMYFMQIDNNLGPLQISLSRTVREVFVFVILFLVFLFAFAMGLFMIYEPYTGQQKTEDGEVIKQIDAFNTLEEAFQTLYWALFGYSPPVFADIVVSDVVTKVNGTTVIHPNHHRLTEVFGQTMFAIYNVIAIIILVNLLIGLLGNTFNEVKAMDDVEWKFARTQIYMRFLSKDSATIPPPFNIVPSFKSFLKVGNWIKRACCNGDARFSLKKGLYIEEKDDKDDEHGYRKLMKTLTMRYLIKKEYEKTQDHLTMADLDALRNDLTELIYKQLHPNPGVPMLQHPSPPNPALSQGIPPYMQQSTPYQPPPMTPVYFPSSPQYPPQTPYAPPMYPPAQAPMPPPPPPPPPQMGSGQQMYPPAPPQTPMFVPQSPYAPQPPQQMSPPYGSHNQMYSLPGSPNQALAQGSQNQGLMQGSQNQGLMQGSQNQGLMQGSQNQGLMQGSQNQGLMQGSQNQGLMQGSQNQGLMQGSQNQGLGQQGSLNQVPSQGASQVGSNPRVYSQGSLQQASLSQFQQSNQGPY